MGRDISIFRHRDPATDVLRMDFTSGKEADPWTQAGQMFVILFLTDAGSVPSDPERGTTFLRDLKAGRIYSDMMLKAAFDFATRDVFTYMRIRGYNQDDDLSSLLASVNLIKWAINAGRVELWVEMLTSTGAVIRYELPIRL